MHHVEVWDPYQYDLLGVIARLLSSAGVQPHAGAGVWLLATLLFCGGPALVAALGGHLWQDDKGRLVMSWRHDYAACIGLGLLLPLALVAANAYYRHTLDPVHAHLWHDIIGPRTRWLAGRSWARWCVAFAVVAAVIGILTDDGPRNLLEHVRFWDSPYAFRLFTGERNPEFMVTRGWLVRLLSAFVHFCAYLAVLQTLSKVLSVNVDIGLRFWTVDLSVFKANINDDFFGLGSVGHAIVQFVRLETVLVVLVLTQQMTASDVKTFAGVPQSVMGYPHLIFLRCFVVAAFAFFLLPLCSVHWSMERFRAAQIASIINNHDPGSITAIGIIKSYSTWPVNLRSFGIAATLFAGALLPQLLTACAPHARSFYERLRP